MLTDVAIVVDDFPFTDGLVTFPFGSGQDVMDGFEVNVPFEEDEDIVKQLLTPFEVSVALALLLVVKPLRIL